MIAIMVAALATEAPFKCAFSAPEHGVLFDLGPLATQRDVSFVSGDGAGAVSLLDLLGGGSEAPESQKTISVSVCGDTRSEGESACRGEHAPGVFTERDAPRASIADGPLANDPFFKQLFGLDGSAPTTPRASRPPRCAVLARRTGGPNFALLDPNDPGKGLALLYEKGDECRPGRRGSLLFLLHCNMGAQGLGNRLSAQVQARDDCRWVVSITTAAACPINAGPHTQCAANCPRTWLGDGACDLGCNTRSCGWDGGDCAAAAPRVAEQRANAAANQCAPGCERAWLGDRECDEECDNAACRFDGGDCTGVCAPGCSATWLKDGECDDECNTGTCAYDGGDCLRNGRPTGSHRCSWGCPAAWMGDGQCDIGCNVTVCGYDRGDCVAGWKHTGAEARGAPITSGPSGRPVGGSTGAGAVGSGTRRPAAAALVAHAEMPSLGVILNAQADLSHPGVEKWLGALGIGAALLFCFCGCACFALLFCCCQASQKQRRYQSYTVVPAGASF